MAELQERLTLFLDFVIVKTESNDLEASSSYGDGLPRSSSFLGNVPPSPIDMGARVMEQVQLSERVRFKLEPPRAIGSTSGGNRLGIEADANGGMGVTGPIFHADANGGGANGGRGRTFPQRRFPIVIPFRCKK